MNEPCAGPCQWRHARLVGPEPAGAGRAREKEGADKSLGHGSVSFIPADALRRWEQSGTACVFGKENGYRTTVDK